MTETWKRSPSFPDYEVSNLGRVRSYKRSGGPKVLKPKPDARGCIKTMLTRDGKRCGVYVHRLVAETFLGPCLDGRKVHHLDGNRSNNRADNLACATDAEIAAHLQSLGLWPSGEGAGQAKLTNEQAREIRTRFKSGGWTQNQLAHHYKVTRPTINLLLRGKTYPNAGGPVYESKRVDKEAIKQDLEAGEMTDAEIAKRYSISLSYVSKIRHGVR